VRRATIDAALASLIEKERIILFWIQMQRRSAAV
jgi:hypothetical protein